MITVLILAILATAGYFAWEKFAPTNHSFPISGTPFATQTVNGLTVKLIHPEGQLLLGANDFLIEFTDASGQLVDVGDVKFDLDMNMPGMVMHNSASVSRSPTVGHYRASIKADMAGDWTVKLQYDGPHGKGQVTFALNVGSSPTRKTEAPPAKALALADNQISAAREFLTVADAISAALARDNTDAFNLSVAKLPPTISTLTNAFGPAHPLRPHIDQVASAIRISPAKNLEQARASFIPFTTAAADLTRALRQDPAFASVKVYKCPMAPKPGKTTLWIQLKAPLRNPFYGSEMLDCGSEVAP